LRNASYQQKLKDCIVVCAILRGISSSNLWTQVTTDLLQHQAHNEMYRIDAFYDNIISTCISWGQLSSMLPK